MKKCPNCGKEVESISTVCPECDYNFIQSDKKETKKFSKIGLVSFFVGVIALFTFDTGAGALICFLSAVLSGVVVASKKNIKKGFAIAGLVLSLFGFVASLGKYSNEVEKADNKAEVESDMSKKGKKKEPKKTSKPKNTPKPTTKPTSTPKITPTLKPTQKPKSDKQKMEEYMKSCKSYTYKDVLRNPDKYVGKKVKIKVMISSVHEESLFNDTKYYFAYSKSDYGWYGNEYAIFDKRGKQSEKLLEDDIIEVYGEIAEPEDTVSLITNSTELFAIDMKYSVLIDE